MTGIVVFIVLAVFSAPVWWPRLQHLLHARAKEAELAAVRLIQEPVLICSQYPGDATVSARAERLRVLVLESGNTWITPTDVHVRVYHPNMGKGQDVSLTFATWRGLVEREYDQVLQKWFRENQTISNDILHTITGQQPANGQTQYQ